MDGTWWERQQGMTRDDEDRSRTGLQDTRMTPGDERQRPRPRARPTYHDGYAILVAPGIWSPGAAMLCEGL